MFITFNPLMANFSFFLLISCVFTVGPVSAGVLISFFLSALTTDLKTVLSLRAAVPFPFSSFLAAQWLPLVLDPVIAPLKLMKNGL